mgnify:CR=1 FL=1
MIKSNGGIIGPDNVTTGGAFGSASGVFKLGEVTDLIKDSKWPTAGPQGFNVTNSLRFNRPSSDYLNRTQSGGSAPTKATFSTWLKRTNLGIETWMFDAPNSSNQSDGFRHLTGDTLQFLLNDSYVLTTNRLFRDVSAWYHLVVAMDTTQNTDSNRVKLYVNGVQETSFSATSYPSQNATAQGLFVSGRPLYIGRQSGGNYLDGYLAETVFIDGQALDPTSFGETDSQTGIWIPKDVSGLTFGTNGFYLDFKDSSALGNDAAGSNNFTVNNLTSLDQSTDTCTTNFATWNPLFRRGTITPTFTNGSLTSDFTGGAQQFALTTFGASSGKWYAEMKWVSSHGNAACVTGILDMAFSGTADPNGAVTNAFSYFASGNKNVSGSSSSYGASYGAGDIIGIAIDCDNSKLYFSKNGVYQNSGVPTSGSTGTGAIPIISGVTYGIYGSEYDGRVADLNTGNAPYAISSGNADTNGFGNFEYAVPTGFLSLNTKNLTTVLA